MTHQTPPRRERIRDWASRETSGGVLLLIASCLALIWANSPWQTSYRELTELTVGPETLHLNLPLRAWAADGVLALFFFLVGVELKHEFVSGALRQPKQAAVPIVAAVGGMAIPAGIYLVCVMWLKQPSAIPGWAIPTATDIAFALAVLAVFGRGLPWALRTFLMTLAVVDDLLAIAVIAVFYTDEISWLALLGSLLCITLFGFLVRRRRARWWLIVPVALVAWALMHASGVHATVSGVLMGMCLQSRLVYAETEPRTLRTEHLLRPYSAMLVLPIFAFFSAGVTVDMGQGIVGLLKQPVMVAVIGGLVIGKVVGVLGTTALVTRLTPLRLPDAIGLRDLLPVGFLTGIGFTVSLLIVELSFGHTETGSVAKLAVLVASALAAAFAAFSLRWDARKARSKDMNLDGIPYVDTRKIGEEHS